MIDREILMEPGESPFDVDLQAEQSVLGVLMRDGAPAYDMVAGLLRAECFEHPLHQVLWSTMEAMVLAGDDVDPIVVMKKLEGGTDLGYLSNLAQEAGSIHGIKRHATILANAAAYRRLVLAATQAKADVDDFTLTIDQRAARAVSRYEAAVEDRVGGEAQPIAHFAADFLQELDDLAEGKVELGRETGIPGLDEILSGGWYPGQLVVIAARPSVGKSSFAQQLALNQAAKGYTAAFVGMEMSEKELVRRTVANLGRVPLRGLKTGQLSPDDWGRVAEAAGRLGDLQLLLEFRPGATLVEIVTGARKMVRKHALKFLVVDYLQLMQGSNERQDRRVQLQEITRSLKQMAGKLGLTVVLLSQLNRDVEKRTDPRPTLADLKECGAIEEDADVVLALWDHRKGGIDEPSIKGLRAIKGRDIGQSELALHFEGKFQRWSESTESLIRSETTPSRGKAKRYPDDY
ncbi:replicative DNA helicase [Delftia acidovorans]|uniref:replicative DNA helicase n=1 Tax=Delftia acidovorans TaxID=80866 RepID=UPI003D09A607